MAKSRHAKDSKLVRQVNIAQKILPQETWLRYLCTFFRIRPYNMPYGFHEILKIIFPGVKTEGHNLTIPMPGHPISDSIRQKVQEDYEKLEALISR